MYKGSKRYGLIDLATGEVLEAVITPWRGRVGGKWMKVFQDTKREILQQNPQLRGESYKVLHYLEAAVAWGNRLPTPTEVAGALGLLPTNVHRAFAQLVKAECIIKRDGTYYLSPLIGWKGSEKQLEEAYGTIFARRQTPQLVAPQVKG